MAKEPLASGVVVRAGSQHATELAELVKETLSILRALDAQAQPADAAPAETDFVVLLVDEGTRVDSLALPALPDRAGTVVAVGANAPAARVVVTQARKRLRAAGAALGARELVFSPADFGYLGLESDGRRERLEILLRALVLDAERLRLKREGWEEP